uniref:Peroxisomal membrane protein PMP34 n=2 Tax=Cacopsylla melanoneura TaxID=428564 RepID=A0A8D8YJ89_9HEMI
MELSNLFTYETLVHAIAGATGSVIGVTTFYPLEIIKVRSIINNGSSGESKNVLQKLEQIIKEEGIHALYQGLEPMVKSLCMSNFVYFYTFHALKSIHSGSSGAESSSILTDLCLSSIAGIINVLTTTPLWVVNTRLKVSNQYSGLLHGLIKVYKEEGLASLWNGTFASLILVSNPAIQMSVYELLKRYSVHVNNSSAKFFILASLSKIVSTLITYPVQIAQNVQRLSKTPSSPEKEDSEKKKSKRSAQSMIEIIMYIFKYEGIRGLYKGVEAKILQTVLTAALMFVAYEKIVSLIFRTFSIEKKLK